MRGRRLPSPNRRLSAFAVRIILRRVRRVRRAMARPRVRIRRGFHRACESAHDVSAAADASCPHDRATCRAPRVVTPV